jgi:predicted nucleic acid-binding protein
LIAVDTSVIVAALWRGHPKHELAYAFMTSGHELVCTQHAWAEVFSVLTSTALTPRRSPATIFLIMRGIRPKISISPLTPADYEFAISVAVKSGTGGGAVYDLLHLAGARSVSADKLVTLNLRHFARFATDFGMPVCEPFLR